MTRMRAPAKRARSEAGEEQSARPGIAVEGDQEATIGGKRHGLVASQPQRLTPIPIACG